jgi:hypothetical protein
VLIRLTNPNLVLIIANTIGGGGAVSKRTRSVVCYQTNAG